ncbi:3-hydroxyacyl-ACP dehydratase FabZ [Clostridia bacterium]|nr:3-hydroxyacyl-ACP dehydratase FabZ [Clostridia bacterium]
MYDQDYIKTIIPHRDPFLLIDSITEYTPVTSAVALKQLTGNEDFFRGHFPDYPVMPGVLILEALAQTGAFVVLSMDEYKGKIALFAGADEVKWSRQVKPGDTLKLKVQVEKIRFGVGIASAEASVNGSVVCTAKIKFALQK